MFDLKEMSLDLNDEVNSNPQPAKKPSIQENVINTEDNKDKVAVDNSSVIMDNQVVTDDQFFDDFFGDDE